MGVGVIIKAPNPSGKFMFFPLPLIPRFRLFLVRHFFNKQFIPMVNQRAATIPANAGPSNWVETTEIAIPEPPAGKIVVKTVAYAANPTDWKHVEFQQSHTGDIAGSDASGVVYKVGEGVTDFQVGDVVSTFSHGNFVHDRGCFAEYIIGDVETTIKYPNGGEFPAEKLPVGEYRSGAIDTFEGAASVTLGLTTVVLSLVGNLNIDPAVDHSDEYLLVWGGATATGILAIQVAKLGLGIKVVTVASKKHTEYLKTLGADVVVDYHDEDVIAQIRAATKGAIKYALDTVAQPETWQSVYDATRDSEKASLDNLLMLPLSSIKQDDRDPASITVAPSTLAYVANGEDVELFGAVMSPDASILSRYNNFWKSKLPLLIPNLKHAQLKVLAPGFNSANEAFDLLRDGKVSAEKVVFSL